MKKTQRQGKENLSCVHEGLKRRKKVVLNFSTPTPFGEFELSRAHTCRGRTAYVGAHARAQQRAADDKPSSLVRARETVRRCGGEYGKRRIRVSAVAWPLACSLIVFEEKKTGSRISSCTSGPVVVERARARASAHPSNIDRVCTAAHRRRRRRRRRSPGVASDVSSLRPSSVRRSQILSEYRPRCARPRSFSLFLRPR